MIKVVKDFSFPHYKKTAWLSLLIIVPRFTDDTTIKILVTIILALAAIYWIFGDHKELKRKDELERLIELEQTYLGFQIGGAILLILYLIHTYFKFNFELSDVGLFILIAFSFIKKSIKKKYQ